nr:cysteine-rich venom protein 6-like [Megalopta genalis]
MSRYVLLLLLLAAYAESAAVPIMRQCLGEHEVWMPCGDWCNPGCYLSPKLQCKVVCYPELDHGSCGCVHGYRRDADGRCIKC